MNAAVVLPHTLLYGGVKRFFELGASLAKLGHRMTVFTPDGAPPAWGDYDVAVRRLSELAATRVDVLFFTERNYFEAVLQADAEYKVFYHVRASDRVRRIVSHPQIHVFACSTNIYRHDRFWYGVAPFRAVGGVDCDVFVPKRIQPRTKEAPFVVMTYGRLTERRKGTRYVVAACERLHRRFPNVRLLLFDTPVNPDMRKAAEGFRTTVPFDFVLDHPIENNPALFHRADVFVAAERNAGWANTVAEALASGVPTIATRSGTMDMIQHGETGLLVRRSVRSIEKAIERVMTSPTEFSSRLAENGRRHIERYDWDHVAAKIVNWYVANEANRFSDARRSSSPA